MKPSIETSSPQDIKTPQEEQTWNAEKLLATIEAIREDNRSIHNHISTLYTNSSPDTIFDELKELDVSEANIEQIKIIRQKISMINSFHTSSRWAWEKATAISNNLWSILQAIDSMEMK